MNTRRIIYAGRRRGSTRPLVYSYVEEATGEERYFNKALLPGVAVGYVLEVTIPEDAPASIYTKGQHAPRIVGFAEDDERVLGWQIADRAAYEVKAGEDAAKRQEARARNNLLEHHLKFVAEAASGLGWREQDAFIRYVSNRIREGR